MKKNSENIFWTLAYLLIVLAYFFGLFIDLTGDSGLYAAISRQMAESGNWYCLKINGAPYDQKPHLFFWLAGSGISLFGNTNLAFKLFPFLYGMLGLYFTYRLGKQVFSEKAGKWAVLIAGTSQIYFLYFFDFHTDSVLQTGVILALWQLAVYLQSQKPINFVFGFLGTGLAMLSKGPVGAILPFFAVLLYLLVTRDFKQLFHPKWILGILIVFIVISPSLIHLYQSFGPEGLKFYFITNNIGRITGSYAGSSADYFFYIHTILWAFLPWTLIVVAALYSTIKSWIFRKPVTEWGIYLLGSVLILLIILSIAKGKAPNYFLIGIAPIAVIAGNWLVQNLLVSERKKRILSVAQIVLIVFQSAFLIFVIIVFSENKVRIPVILIFLAVIAFFLITQYKKPVFQKTILATLLVTGATNLFLNAKAIPGLYTYQGARQALKLFEEKRNPQAKLYNLSLEEYNLFFYAPGHVENIENWVELREVFSTPGTWFYTNETEYGEMLFQKFPIDTVYQINQRGMNRITMKFLNPSTRKNSLTTNYLIVSGEKKSE